MRKITEEDVRRTLKEVVSAIFEPEKVDVVVACGGILKEVRAAHTIQTNKC